MIVRANASVRGHSAMTREILDTVLELLNRDIVPIIPLRGSISASGDLMPPSYVSGAIQGNADVYVRVGGRDGTPRVMTAQEALRNAWIEPIVLGPKEGLGLINGTPTYPPFRIVCIASAP